MTFLGWTVTEWTEGALCNVQSKRVPHTRCLPLTCSLRELLRDGDIEGVAPRNPVGGHRDGRHPLARTRKIRAGGYSYTLAIGIFTKPSGPRPVLRESSLSGVCFKSTTHLHAGHVQVLRSTRLAQGSARRQVCQRAG